MCRIGASGGVKLGDPCKDMDSDSKDNVEPNAWRSSCGNGAESGVDDVAAMESSVGLEAQSKRLLAKVLLRSDSRRCAKSWPQHSASLECGGVVGGKSVQSDSGGMSAAA